MAVVRQNGLVSGSPRTFLAGVSWVPVEIGPPSAAFAGFVAGALVHVPAVWAAARSAGANVFAAMAVDVLHVACAGALAAGTVRAFMAWPRRRLLFGVLALWLLSLAIGWIGLEPDFHNFGIRHSNKLPPWLTRLLLTGATSAVLPLALVAGRLLARFRFGPWLGLCAAGVAFFMNERILPRDYTGIHLYLGWTAATLAGASLAGAAVPLPFRLRRLSTGATLGFLLGAGVVGFALLGLVRPSARVQSALAGLDASSLVPYTGKLYVAFRRRAAKPAVHDQWLEPRKPAAGVASVSERAKRMAVILITVDALRADVVASGNYDDLLPNFAKLRKQSIVFTQARAPGTATRPSLACMMMGTYTFQQYWVEQRGIFGAMPMRDTSIRFSELLTQSRVRTANITSMRSLLGERGIMRGFKHDGKAGKAGKGYAPAAKVIDEVSKFLDTRRPLFTASHLGDPHEPYDLAGKKGGPFQRYLGEVALVDKALGRLLERLSGEKFSRRTVLIVSADHGESFGEHASSSHGTTVYDEVLHVPMFMYAPDIEPRVVDDLVSLIDVGPTVLDLFDLPTPAHFMGQSLAPYLRGETPKLTRPIIGEARSLLAYVTPDRLKVILDTDTGRTELYDLRKDPLELDNVADDTARLSRPLAYLEKFYETHRLRRKGYTPPPIR